MQHTWPDEQAFHAANPRRRLSAEVDLGATWRYGGSSDNAAYRVAWIRETGELYACRADSYDGSCTDVEILAVIAAEDDLDATVFGWRDARHAPDGLDWLRSRLELVAA